MPGFVHEVRIAGNGIHFCAELLELIVIFGHIFQLGGAHKGEIRRVENEDGPLAAHVFIGDGFEFTVVEGLHFELRDAAIDNWHNLLLFEFR